MKKTKLRLRKSSVEMEMQNKLLFVIKFIVQVSIEHNLNFAFLITSIFKVNGKWTEWSQWTSDSPSNQIIRSRTCTNPPPQFGGQFCSGNDFEAQSVSTMYTTPGKTLNFIHLSLTQWSATFFARGPDCPI